MFGHPGDYTFVDQQLSLLEDLVALEPGAQDECAADNLALQSDCAQLVYYIDGSDNLIDPDGTNSCFQDGTNRWCTLASWSTCQVQVGWRTDMIGTYTEMA
jgi:hypothetical protein